MSPILSMHLGRKFRLLDGNKLKRGAGLEKRPTSEDDGDGFGRQRMVGESIYRDASS